MCGKMGKAGRKHHHGMMPRDPRKHGMPPVQDPRKRGTPPVQDPRKRGMPPPQDVRKRGTPPVAGTERTAQNQTDQAQAQGLLRLLQDPQVQAYLQARGFGDLANALRPMTAAA